MISNEATPCPQDHVNRRSKAERPNAPWLTHNTNDKPAATLST